MSDVPQAPYGEEGDARPVSLIGARIPASSPPPTDPPASGTGSGSARDERLARRRRRRSGEATSAPPGVRDAEAFHLHDTHLPDAHQPDTHPDDAHPHDSSADHEFGSVPNEAATEPLAAGTAGWDEPAWPDDAPGPAAPEPAGSVVEATTTDRAGSTPTPPDDRSTPEDQGTPDDRSAPDDRGAQPATRRTPPVRGSGRRRRATGRPSAVPPPAVAPSVAPPPKAPTTSALARAAMAVPAATEPAAAEPAAAEVPVPPAAAATAARPETLPPPPPGYDEGQRWRHRRGTEPPTRHDDQDAQPDHDDRDRQDDRDDHRAVPTGTDLGDGGRHPASLPPEPSRELVWVPDPGPSPAVRDDVDAEPRPWQEPFERTGDLEPWEEIPVRLSLADRASAALTGSWRIVVTSLFAGSGTTTVTAGLGLVLADVRREGVVAVDSSLATDLVGNGGPSGQPTRDPAALGVSLTRRLGARPVTTISSLARHRTDPFPPPDLVMLVSGEPATRPAGAVDVVAARATDLRVDRHESGAVEPVDDLVTPSALRASLRMLSEGYPLVLLDAPGDCPLTPTVLRGADVVVLVVLATPNDLDAAAADLRDPDGISARLGEPPPPVVAVVVSARRGRWSPQTRAAAARLSRRVDAMLRLPYDVRLDSDAGAPRSIGRLRRRSRRALLGLAAVLVDTLVDEEDTHAATASDGERGTGGWDLEKGSGVSSDHLRSASPIGDAPDRPGGAPPARKDS